MPVSVTHLREHALLEGGVILLLLPGKLSPGKAADITTQRGKDYDARSNKDSVPRLGLPFPPRVFESTRTNRSSYNNADGTQGTTVHAFPIRSTSLTQPALAMRRTAGPPEARAAPVGRA
jgi:hypothetical protein